MAVTETELYNIAARNYNGNQAANAARQCIFDVPANDAGYLEVNLDITGFGPGETFRFFWEEEKPPGSGNWVGAGGMNSVAVGDASGVLQTEPFTFSYANNPTARRARPVIELVGTINTPIVVNEVRNPQV